MKSILFFVIIGLGVITSTGSEAALEKGLVYSLQTSSFASVETALEEYNALAETLSPYEGLSVRVEPVEPYYPVRIGRFDDISEAYAVLDKIQNDIPEAIIVKCYRNNSRIISESSQLSQPLLQLVSQPELEQETPEISRTPLDVLSTSTEQIAIEENVIIPSQDESVITDVSSQDPIEPEKLEKQVEFILAGMELSGIGVPVPEKDITAEVVPAKLPREEGTANVENESVPQYNFPSPAAGPGSYGAPNEIQTFEKIFLLLIVSLLGMTTYALKLNRKLSHVNKVHVEQLAEADQRALAIVKPEVSRYFRTNPPANINEVKCKIEELTGRKFMLSQIKQFVRTL